MSLAAVLIVKNEEAHLRACLETLSWVDEIVVVDSGSTDATRDIARTFTDKVVVQDDWQGFGVQRQRAEALVVSDWVLMVDADERVTPELRDSIEAAVALDQPVIYTLPRLSWCFGAFIRHSAGTRIAWLGSIRAGVPATTPPWSTRSWKIRSA
ncbi:glycosyltransferase family 2 protein [Halomonas sp. BC04]|uniref:glycosyltransferase family 2 protein n=1 Tax=Halomonas sp. BC04 TaxID=1403540 RepID=UPI0004B6E502